MIADLMSLNISASMMTIDDIFPRERSWDEVRDITDTFYNLMFPDIPKSKTGQIVFKALLMVGLQGTGKSETIKYDVWKCIEKYGAENVEIINAVSYRDVLDNITGTKPIVFAIVDDAMKYQNSRRSMSKDSADLVADYNETRHMFERRSKGRVKNAVIIVETAVQRWHGLDITLRTSAELIRFKSSESDMADKRTIGSLLGPAAMQSLEGLWMHINTDNSLKNMSVGRIANFPLPLGAGIVKNRYVPDIDPSFELPPVAGTKSETKVSEVVWTPEDPLADVKDVALWPRKIEAYNLSLNGMKQQQISAYMKTMHNKEVARCTVSTWIKDVKELVDSRVGDLKDISSNTNIGEVKVDG
ncbi:MAG: hypothetical protein M0P07_07590 [Candidatus Methanomethylophilaceae archaeon]|nr:hypothetical protein [Candidatus Methanomethylophilaceae archaeon]MDY0247357.1 hypothetical protein [Methanosarcina mazei]